MCHDKSFLTYAPNVLLSFDIFPTAQILPSQPRAAALHKVLLFLFLAFGGAALLCQGLFLGRLLGWRFLGCTLFRSRSFRHGSSSLLFAACSFWCLRRRRSFLLRQFRRGKPLAVKRDLS